MLPEVMVGTSGWSYDHWQECFYPLNIPKSKWFDHYLNHFDTVELNASFYRLPKRISFENWYKKSPEGFLWSVKANRYITHVKKLGEPAQTLKRFYESVSALGKKLGVILFQLPPSLSFHPMTLDNFCKFLEPEYRYSLEIRHPSWLNEEAINILRKYNIAFCISDTAGRFPYHEEITTDFIYIRLHGSKSLYTSNYHEEELKSWSQKIRKWGLKTFLYFDNDYGGYAPQNALRIKELLGLVKKSDLARHKS
jgi:uncharacterized protein YecE (DUF72 family)